MVLRTYNKVSSVSWPFTNFQAFNHLHEIYIYFQADSCLSKQVCIKKILNIYISLSRKGLTESLRVPLKMCVGCVHQVMCTTPASTQSRGNKLIYSGKLSSSTCIRQIDYFQNKDGQPYFTETVSFSYLSSVFQSRSFSCHESCLEGSIWPGKQTFITAGCLHTLTAFPHLSIFSG